MIRAKKEMGQLHAVHKSIAVGKLGKHLSAPAWAILNHAFAWSTWDRCEYRSGIRSIATALGLDTRQVKRGMSELVALGIFTPQDRSPTASKREATVYIVSAPRRFDDGRLQLITGEVAPTKHAGRTARNAKNPNSATLLKVKNKTKSVAVLMSETKAAKAALLKQKQEQNVERVRVEQAKQEQERLERERVEQLEHEAKRVQLLHPNQSDSPGRSDQVTSTDGNFQKGSRVIHPMFGSGFVELIFDSKEKTRMVRVNFQKAGVKNLVIQYAKLELEKGAA